MKAGREGWKGQTEGKLSVTRSQAECTQTNHLSAATMEFDNGVPDHVLPLYNYHCGMMHGQREHLQGYSPRSG